MNLAPISVLCIFSHHYIMRKVLSCSYIIRSNFLQYLILVLISSYLDFCFCEYILLNARRSLDSVLWNHSRPIVCLSVRPFVINFLMIGLLVFSDIVSDDSWPRYLVTEEEFGHEIGPNRAKSDPKWGFSHFLEFWSQVFLKYD